MRRLRTLVTALVAAIAACGLENPGAVVEDAGCGSDADCKAPRVCEIPFGEQAGTCEYPEEAGGTGGTGGAGGTGGTQIGCDEVCEVLSTCIGVPVDTCLQFCDEFPASCRVCVVAACEAGQDPDAACADSCEPG